MSNRVLRGGSFERNPFVHFSTVADAYSPVVRVEVPDVSRSEIGGLRFVLSDEPTLKQLIDPVSSIEELIRIVQQRGNP